MSVDWLAMLANDEAKEREAQDAKRQQMWEYYIKSRQWSKDNADLQLRQQAEARKEQYEASRDARADARAQREDARAAWKQQYDYAQAEREMIFKNIKVLQDTNNIYWKIANDPQRGRKVADKLLQDNMNVKAATIQAIQAYQGTYRNQQVTSGTDGLLQADKGFYTLPAWKAIQTGLKNDPVLLDSVRNNLVAYAQLPAEARETELNRYTHDLQLAKASLTLNQQAGSPEDVEMKLQEQTNYLLSKLPPIPEPGGYGQDPARVPPQGPPEGPYTQPSEPPRAHVPRSAFAGYMTVTEDDGSKRTYMMPTEAASDDVLEAMDMYNHSDKAVNGVHPEDWYTARRAFTDFLNSPEEDYLEPRGLHHDRPARPRDPSVLPAPGPY